MMHIIEPNTHVKYYLFSYKGKELLKNYIKLFKIGGSKKSEGSKKTKTSSSRTATTEEIKKTATTEEEDPLRELVNKLMKKYKGPVDPKYEHTDYKDREFNQLYEFLKKKKFKDYNKIKKDKLVIGSIFNTSNYWRSKIFK
jgi:hypothetical protein